MEKRKYKFYPEGQECLEEIIPLSYKANYDGICITGGSLQGTGFVSFSKGITLPCEIDGRVVTELEGTYRVDEIEHIEARNIERVSLTIKGDTGMMCRMPAFLGGMQDTVKSVKLVFEAPWMHYDAFNDREEITDITFSGVVAEISDWDDYFIREGFKNCTNLQAVRGVFKGHRLEESTFENCTSLTVVPELDVKNIANKAFCNCSSLKEIHLPDGLQVISFGAFAYCTSLKDLYVPDTVVSIESSAFNNCTSLRTIHLPDTLDKISAKLFYNCESLEKVFLSDSITEIGDSAFYNCRMLQRPWIPQEIKKIGANAFCGCRSISEVTLPEGIEEIGENAFGDIPHLIIKGDEGSVAERYAKENGITFVIR